MAAFIAKQVVGKQLDSVKGALGDKEEDKKTEAGGDDDPEIAEAKREAEEKRNEKYRKMEEEREKMRQDIRDKYGIRKKEMTGADQGQDLGVDASRSGRKSKSADVTAEGEGGETAEGDCQSADDPVFPRSFSDLSSKVSELPSRMAATVNDVTDKCLLQ